MVSIKADGSAYLVKVKFQDRFIVNSTPERVSSFIYGVTADDDSANGEFSCHLIDSNADVLKRAIHVQVKGKLESVADFKEGVP